MEPDPLEDLLRRPAPPPGDDPLRRTVLLQTLRSLRRRRWGKRLAVVGALAACYLAGILTVRLLSFLASPGESRVAVKPDKQEKERKEEPRPAPKPPKPEEPPSARPESALALEWQAIDHPERRAELYRRAGDHYFKENDVASALRCYRGALAAAPRKEWNIHPDDNWVLLIAKQDRPKEKDHAKKRG